MQAIDKLEEKMICGRGVHQGLILSSTLPLDRLGCSVQLIISKPGL
jgi:hypothetical protein